MKEAVPIVDTASFHVRDAITIILLSRFTLPDVYIFKFAVIGMFCYICVVIII